MTAIERAKGRAHQPVVRQIFILDARERRESEGKNGFSLVLKSSDGAIKDRISNQSICFGKPPFGRAEIAHDFAADVDGIEKRKSLQTTVGIEGKKLADVDLVVEDGGPRQERHLAVLHPARLPPPFRDRLEFFAVERCHRALHNRVTARGRMIERSSEVLLPWPVETIAIEFQARFGPHRVDAKADLFEDFGGSPRSLPEADVASLAHEPADQILATTDRRQRIGKNEGGAAHLFVGKERFLVSEIAGTWLKGRRIGQREVSMLSQCLQARFCGEFVGTRALCVPNNGMHRCVLRGKLQPDSITLRGANYSAGRGGNFGLPNLGTGALNAQDGWSQRVARMRAQ